VQMQTDNLDLDSILHDLNQDQLYDFFIPLDDVFGAASFNSMNTASSSDDQLADFFQELPDIQSTPAHIKPDPDAPFHLPFSSHFMNPGSKKRKGIVEVPFDGSKKQRWETETIATPTPLKAEVTNTIKRGKRERDDKYLRRLKANKKSAQASRERKKEEKIQLEQVVEELSKENKLMETEITQMETENKVLKGEFVQLQKLISDSAILSKLMARAASMQLAASDNERMMKEASSSKKIPFSLSKDSFSNVNPAAFMYLLIVLQSFGQYFSSMKQSDLTGSQSVSAPLSVM